MSKAPRKGTQKVEEAPQGPAEAAEPVGMSLEAARGFWASLPKESVAALAATMPRVAGPLRQNRYDSQPSLRRSTIYQVGPAYAETPGWIVQQGDIWRVYLSSISSAPGVQFKTKEEAVAFADRMLAEEGWVFLDTLPQWHEHAHEHAHEPSESER